MVIDGTTLTGTNVVVPAEVTQKPSFISVTDNLLYFRNTDRVTNKYGAYYIKNAKLI